MASSDTEKVMAVLPNFQYSEAMTSQDSAEIKSQLQAESTQAAEAKATLQTQMDAAHQQLQQAEGALEKVKESERQGVAQLEAKVNSLIAAQEQLKTAQDEKKKVELEHHDDILVGKELREAKSKNISIKDSTFESLLKGGLGNKQELEMLKDYLREIGTEKTLVMASDGLLTEPEGRGDFDKMTIECITEELEAKLKTLEEKLSERASGEREVQAEILGLDALVDICQQKVAAEEENHKQMEVAVKSCTKEIKACKQQVKKFSKELEGLSAKMETEETKAKSLEEAFAALDRLADVAAKAQAAAAEKAAAEAAAAEAAAAAAKAATAAAAAAKAAEAKEAPAPVEDPVMASPAEDREIQEPPAKRMRADESEAREAKLEAQVASPARQRISIG